MWRWVVVGGGGWWWVQWWVVVGGGLVVVSGGVSSGGWFGPRWCCSVVASAHELTHRCFQSDVMPNSRLQAWADAQQCGNFDIISDHLSSCFGAMPPHTRHHDVLARCLFASHADGCSRYDAVPALIHSLIQSSSRLQNGDLQLRRGRLRRDRTGQLRRGADPRGVSGRPGPRERERERER